MPKIIASTCINLNQLCYIQKYLQQNIITLKLAEKLLIRDYCESGELLRISYTINVCTPQGNKSTIFREGYLNSHTHKRVYNIYIV